MSHHFLGTAVPATAAEAVAVIRLGGNQKQKAPAFSARAFGRWPEDRQIFRPEIPEVYRF
jgi:hypothetical protein